MQAFTPGQDANLEIHLVDCREHGAAGRRILVPGPSGMHPVDGPLGVGMEGRMRHQTPLSAYGQPRAADR